MRKTAVLRSQHIGWHFYKHWVIQGKRRPIETGAEKVLKNKNITLYKPEDFLKEKRVFEKVEIIGYKNKPQPLDQTHPDWHEKPLLSIKDNNVLLEGLKQARIITNTVQIQEGLPENFKLNDLSREVDQASQNVILSSHLFDAEQKKLPKLKDPNRPAWNFPRIYGITQERRNKLMTYKLLQLLEFIADPELVKQRYVFEDLYFSFPFEKNGKLAQFELKGDIIISSVKPLTPITNTSTENMNLPIIDPIDPFITFNKENIYKLQDIYPINPSVNAHHPHTLFITFDKEFVTNLYEEEVTEDQIFGRSLLKTFTVAATYARRKYGKDVKILKNPVTLQCVQTDGHFFHFGVLQLNTLDLENESVKNIWYQTPMQYMFETCSYKFGKPTLEGYNNQIVRQLNCMYNFA
ncbi:39S ribosomal protein L37, mitochondrial [Diorhabda carinulata]|uniref:39S ribosomal protein L37, mitochondrial n=1 Tax=Diorhabda carinulata TaxID=1163345 RepID=UPI0025A1E853|nr:39S ribosomal protein L37, mitochondrial [Diorhabda carinulata]